VADELVAAVGTTGLTIDAYVYSPSGGTIWSTVSFGFFLTTAEAWGNYAISLLEQDDIASDPTGVYVGSFPAEIETPGPYPVVYRRRTGGGPDPADPVVGVGTVEWNGAAVAGAGDVRLADGVQHGGTTARIRLGAVGSAPGLHATGAADVPAVQFEHTTGTTGAAFRIVSTAGVGLYVSSGSSSAAIFTGAQSIVADLHGAIFGPVESVGANGITSSSLATSAVTEIQAGLATAAAVAALPTAAQNAAAWGVSVLPGALDPSYTRDYFLQGGVVQITSDAPGTTFTVVGADGTTLATMPATRLSTSVGGLRAVGPPA
jgi:hypothetical protein